MKLSALARRRTTASTPAVHEKLPGTDATATSVLHALQANVMVADTKLNLVYVNPKALSTLQGLGREIETAFRVRLVDLIGGSIHRFHKDPQRVERLLRDPGFRGHDVAFTFGAVTLDAHINRILDDAGSVCGFVVAWDDISDKVEARRVRDALAASLTETLGKTEEINVDMTSVSAAMEEMTATVEEIARNGTSTTEIVGTAVGVVGVATEKMRGLGEATTKIDEVARTIAQIASQTNLLALNATIEAARAGDAGKGFAVVATEVKELANQTRMATERIAQMVGDVQTLSHAANAAMDEVADVVALVSDGQGAIAAAVEEQTATNREISRNLSQAAARVDAVRSEVSEFVAANAADR